MQLLSTHQPITSQTPYGSLAHCPQFHSFSTWCHTAQDILLVTLGQLPWFCPLADLQVPSDPCWQDNTRSWKLKGPFLLAALFSTSWNISVLSALLDFFFPEVRRALYQTLNKTNSVPSWNKDNIHPSSMPFMSCSSFTISYTSQLINIYLTFLCLPPQIPVICGLSLWTVRGVHFIPDLGIHL